VEPLALGAAAPGGAAVGALAADSSWLAVMVGRTEDCVRHDAGAMARIRTDAVLGGAHVLSASLVGFARGVNDTPKILGLLVGAAVVAPTTGAIGITLAMALGGLVAARRVAETTARKITTMTPEQGLVANLSTSLLVIGASRFGMPVSTGGIVGIGQSTGTVRWGTTLEVLAAWLTTLPLAALLGAGTMWLLR
jgi:PiT family inorganic phosphate transporter